MTARDRAEGRADGRSRRWYRAKPFTKRRLRARQAYRAVLKADPENPRAWFLLGAVFQATGRGEEAIRVLREATRLGPVNPRSWNLLGVALAAQGRPAEAERCFRSVLQLQPGHAEAARNLERRPGGRRPVGVQPGDESAFLPIVGEHADPVAYYCGRAYALCMQERFAEAEVLVSPGPGHPARFGRRPQ